MCWPAVSEFPTAKINKVLYVDFVNKTIITVIITLNLKMSKMVFMFLFLTLIMYFVFGVQVPLCMYGGKLS